MIILGIDPGLATIGYGVINKENQNISLVDYGIISTAAGMPLPKRLSVIYRDMQEIINTHKPQSIAYEELFFYRNVTTAIDVGHARGVCVIAGDNYVGSENLYEYTPMQVKQAVCGYGHADKVQVQQMVKILLNLKNIPKPDDAADALAIAICHAQSIRLGEEFKIK
ncbi:MAG: crossover junction endodeoxyribonuclease RuvC [Clostridia bacterium]|nr:crossover junction endodeoxyribonuclease RuvC [Clostridia bacterium]